MRARATPLLLTVLVTATALAGCFGDEPVVEDPPVVPPPAPQVDNRTLTVQAPGCTQYSGGIVTRPDGYEAFVPPGFEMVRDQQFGQLVQLALIANLCGEGLLQNGTAANATGTYAVIGLPVRPSQGYVDDNYSRNLAPIRIVVQDEGFANRFHEWGLHMTELGTLSAAVTPGPQGEVHELTIQAAATYTVASALGPVGDTFARNNYRLWIHDGANITANLLVDNMEGPRIGQGGHGWQASGDDVLPSQATGIMTVGSGIEAYYRWVEGGTNNPAPVTTRDDTGGNRSTGATTDRPAQV